MGTLPGVQKGAVTVLALFMVAVIVITVVSITLSGATVTLDDSLKQQQRIAALFLAESGLEYALAQLDAANATCDASLAGTVAMGSNSYTVAAGQTTAFDGVSVLPGNQCRVAVNAVMASGARRNIEGIVEFGGGSGIAVDSVVSRLGNNRSTLSWPHTYTGSNGLLVVGVAYRNDTTVATVTYAGVALTQLSSIDAGPDIKLEQWYLTAPATGANTVIVTMAAQTRLAAGSVTFNGVDQLTPISASASSADTAASTPSLSIMVSHNGSWVVDNLGMRGQVAVPTPAAAQTLLWADRTNGNAGNPRVLGGSSGLGPLTPGSYTLEWSASTAPWAMAAMVIKPAGMGSDGVISWRELVSP